MWHVSRLCHDSSSWHSSCSRRCASSSVDKICKPKSRGRSVVDGGPWQCKWLRLHRLHRFHQIALLQSTLQVGKPMDNRASTYREATGSCSHPWVTWLHLVTLGCTSYGLFLFCKGTVKSSASFAVLYHEIGRTMTVKGPHKMEPQVQKDCDLHKHSERHRNTIQQLQTRVATTSKTNDFAMMQASPVEFLMQEWQES